MNRAAEQAAPKAKDIFVDAVKKMTITDARNTFTVKLERGDAVFRKHPVPRCLRFSSP